SPKGPADLSCQGLVLTNFADDGRLNVVTQSVANRNHVLSVDRWKLPSTKPTRHRTVIDLPVNLDPPFASMNSATCRHTNALSADGSFLILAVRKAIHIWDVAAGKLTGTISLKGSPGAISPSPDRSKVAIDGGTTLYVYDRATFGLISKWKIK